MAKKTVPSYEAMCKVQASIYGKMAKALPYTLFSCFVRSATREYALANKDSRVSLFVDAVREDAIGYRIAKALVAQGWDGDTIAELTSDQQYIVDMAEDSSNFHDVLLDTYPIDHSWCRPGNSVRWEWFKAGAPDLPEFTETND